MDLTDDEGHPPRPSSTPGHALYGLDRNGSLNDFEVTSSGESSISKETPSDTTPTSATPTFFVSSCQSSDMDGGSHSSEEELEEINNIPALLPNSSSSSSAMSTPLPETTPVQFSTTPPNHVHKPRRSTSPPPCIPAQGTSLSVHEAAEAANTGTPPSVAEVAALTHPSSNNGGGAVSVYGSGHASPSVQELRSHDGNSIDRRNSLVVVERRAIASKKRYKQSRIHHIQRPCLDFEKMQLVSEFYILKINIG